MRSNRLSLNTKSHPARPMLLLEHDATITTGPPFKRMLYAESNSTGAVATGDQSSIKLISLINPPKRRVLVVSQDPLGFSEFSR
jgi:hypothetical protein